MKRIVVIGASSGIGRRVALEFAKMGWKVAIAGRRIEKLNEVKDQYPDRIVARFLDVTTQDAVEKFNDLIELNGGMDVLLFASGVGFANPLLEWGKDEPILAVNVHGFTRIINAAYLYFKKTENVGRGQIAAITSIAGTKGLGVAPTYSASKRYQRTYLQAIDQLAHMQRVAVSVTDIRPGFVRTALLDADKSYPLTMAVDYAAPLVVKAILRKARIATIDWRWSLVDGIWHLIPGCLWRYLKISL
ncbi:MAG: SDR family NAD(P)-dependent oxidoreductase [Bacteroidales bacterium]|nr:SDR family NAD(P)-dependent oxidoreductase [Bacteroidales bacterium]